MNQPNLRTIEQKIVTQTFCHVRNFIKLQKKNKKVNSTFENTDEKTRVKISGDQDYINANYIVNEPTNFTANTINNMNIKTEFWWQKNIHRSTGSTETYRRGFLDNDLGGQMWNYCNVNKIKRERSSKFSQLKNIPKEFFLLILYYSKIE